MAEILLMIGILVHVIGGFYFIFAIQSDGPKETIDD